MSDKPNQSLLDKLKKLLAMARHDNANENEAETALRQAEALMRKHGLEESDINNSIDIQYDMHAGIAELDHGVNVPKWINYLSVGVGVYTDTIGRMARVHRHMRDVKRLVFCGTREDVQVALWLLPYLMEAIDRERKKDNVGGHVDAYRQAAACALQKRMVALRKERDEVFEASSSTALAVVDNKKAAVEEAFGSSKTDNAKVTGDREAGLKGKQAGERINLNKQIETNKKREALCA